MPFQGELMTCVVCGKQMYSDPQLSSDWRMVEVDGRNHYACPTEFPKDGATEDEYAVSYQIVIACCLNEALRQDGKPLVKEVENYRSAVVALRCRESRRE